MNKNSELQEGQMLKYVGKPFQNFDEENPIMKFLGYDSNGWKELWVEYKGEKIHLYLEYVEPVD